MPSTKHSDQDSDFTKLTFGKYKGKTPEQISETDPAYIVWMYDSITNIPYKLCSLALRNDCANEIRESNAERDSDMRSDRDH